MQPAANRDVERAPIDFTGLSEDQVIQSLIEGNLLPRNTQISEGMHYVTNHTEFVMDGTQALSECQTHGDQVRMLTPRLHADAQQAVYAMLQAMTVQTPQQ